MHGYPVLIFNPQLPVKGAEITDNRSREPHHVVDVCCHAQRTLHGAGEPVAGNKYAGTPLTEAPSRG
jgi:hypothetical protein